MSTEIPVNSKQVVRTYHKKTKRKRECKAPTQGEEIRERIFPTENNAGGCIQLQNKDVSLGVKSLDCGRSQVDPQSLDEIESGEFEHPVEDASRKIMSEDIPEAIEEQLATPEEFFTPPSSPLYSFESIHFWADDFLERYGPAGDSTLKTQSLSKRKFIDELSDAERLFMELERRFYSDPEKKSEQEAFHDVQEIMQDEKRCYSPTSISETSSFSTKQQQQSCVSSQYSDGENESLLRRSKRKFKTKKSPCLGCASCRAPKPTAQSSGRGKARV